MGWCAGPVQETIVPIGLLTHLDHAQFSRIARAICPATTGRYAVIGCKLKQNANEGCNSCASLAGLVLCFIACFILLVIAP